MSRLFLKNLLVILIVMAFGGLEFDEAAFLHAQEVRERELVEIEEEGLDDDDDAPAAVNMLNNWGTSMAKVQGAKKFLLQQDFGVAVEEAIEVCDLDERQLTKLKIASRGAVKKAYEKWKTTGLQQMGINLGNGNAEEDEDKEEVEPEVYTDADDIDMQTMQLAGGMMFNPFQNEIPTDSKFWKKALKASIGEEEYQKLVKYRAQRDQIKKEKNVDSAIEALAYELRLSDKAKREFSELLTPKMLGEDHKNIGPMYEHYVLYYYASKASKSKLKKILTKPQLQKWKAAIGPAKQIGQMVEMQNGQNDGGDENIGWEETTSFLVDLDRAVDDVMEGVTDFVEGVFGK